MSHSNCMSFCTPWSDLKYLSFRPSSRIYNAFLIFRLPIIIFIVGISIGDAGEWQTMMILWVNHLGLVFSNTLNETAHYYEASAASLSPLLIPKLTCCRDPTNPTAPRGLAIERFVDQLFHAVAWSIQSHDANLPCEMPVLEGVHY